MKCEECHKAVSEDEIKVSSDAFEVVLCEKHKTLVQKIVEKNNTPVEAIKLYYALKNMGINPMLAWWNGSKSIDIAISRIKLNIEIETDYKMITHTQVLKDLEEAMHSYSDGFTTIKVPSVVIKYYLEDTLESVMEIINGMKSNIRAI